MALVSFTRISEVFGGGVASEGARKELFKEALFLTLSRATSSDINIVPVEVDSVREIMRRTLGEDVDAADVRVAAASELYEKATLDDYLSVIGRKLAPAERSTIVECLADVIRSDRRVTPREIEFFDWVVSALRASPAEMAGLLEGS